MQRMSFCSRLSLVLVLLAVVSCRPSGPVTGQQFCHRFAEARCERLKTCNSAGYVPTCARDSEAVCCSNLESCAQPSRDPAKANQLIKDCADAFKNQTCAEIETQAIPRGCLATR